MPTMENSTELIIRNKLAAISAMKEWGFENDYVSKRLKEYILFCLRHNDTNMRSAAAKIVSINFPEYKGMLDKYMVLL